MALPTLAANSPSPGFISWTSFSIRFGDVSRTIAAGNTSNLYVYWTWDNGNPGTTLKTTNDRNVIMGLGAEDLVLFVNRNGVPVNVQLTQVIDGTLIVNGSIIGDAIQANTIDATKLQAGTITSREIEAGSITANELSMSSYAADMLVNGDMMDPDPTTKVPAGWTAGFERAGSPVYSTETMQPLSGDSSVAITLMANNTEGMASKAMPVKQGEKLLFTTAFRTNTVGAPITIRCYFGSSENFTAGQLISTTPAAPENVYVYDIAPSGLTLRDNVPTALSGPGIAAILEGWAAPDTTGKFVYGQVTVPAGARWARLVVASGLTANSPAHTTVWDAASCQPVVTSARIADGAIDGKVITGAFIRTAADGARWELAGEGEGTEAQQWLKAFSGMPDETYPGGIETSIAAIDPSGQSGTTGALRLFAPQRSTSGSNAMSALTLYSGGEVSLADGSAGAGSLPEARLESDAIRLDSKGSVFMTAGSRGTFGDPDPGYKGAVMFIDQGGNAGIDADAQAYMSVSTVGSSHGLFIKSSDITLGTGGGKPLSLKGGNGASLNMTGDEVKLIGGVNSGSEIDLWAGGTVTIKSGANLHLGPASGMGSVYAKTQFMWVQPGDAVTDRSVPRALIIGDYGAGETGEPSLRIRRRTSDNLNTTEIYSYAVGGNVSQWNTQLRRDGAVKNQLTLREDALVTTGAVVSAPMRPKDTGTINYVHTTSSVTEVDNTGGPALTFTAPPSGMVKFLVSCYPKAGADGKLAEVGIRVRSGGTIGSGTQVGFEYIASSYVGQYNRIAGFATVEGLTPGATYNARLTLRTNDAAYAASNSQSRILVEACM